MSSQIETTHASQSSAVAGANAASMTLGHTVAALLFGAIVVFAVGFLPMSAAHNAAHDTRHALAFPCH